MDSFDWPSDQEIKNQRKKIINRAFLITLFSLIIIFGVAFFSVYHFGVKLFSGMCGNQTMYRDVQPNGHLELMVFRRDCGATTGYSYQLSIINAGAKLNNSTGNILISEKEFSAKWIDEKTIKVIGNINGEFKKKGHYKGVKVIYSTT